MLRAEKQEFITTLEELYKQFGSIIITHYHGLTVAQITSLRRSLKTTGGGFKIVKNTLSKIAALKTGLDNIAHLFIGPSAIAYSTDPIETAKIIVGFAQTNENLRIIGGVINDTVFSVELIQQLAKLPPLNEIRGKIIGILQAPAVRIVNVLQAPTLKFVRVLQAYSD